MIANKGLLFVFQGKKAVDRKDIFGLWVTEEFILNGLTTFEGPAAGPVKMLETTHWVTTTTNSWSRRDSFTTNPSILGLLE
jgi:hypothetical protein